MGHQKRQKVNHGETRTHNPQIRSLMRYPLRHAALNMPTAIFLLYIKFNYDEDCLKFKWLSSAIVIIFIGVYASCAAPGILQFPLNILQLVAKSKLD